MVPGVSNMVSTVLVSTRKTKERAEKLKKHLERESNGLVKANIVKKDEIYEIRARPNGLGNVLLGTADEKRFASYLRVIQYGPDGEII